MKQKKEKGLRSDLGKSLGFAFKKESSSATYLKQIKMYFKKKKKQQQQKKKKKKKRILLVLKSSLKNSYHFQMLLQLWKILTQKEQMFLGSV